MSIAVSPPEQPPASSAEVDLVKQTDGPARLGRNELGRIDVEPKVVEKIAAQAAVEIPDAGGAAAEVGGFAGGGAVWEVVPSEFKFWPGAAGGGELFHPLRTRAAERAKAAAKGNDFELIGRISI